MTTPSGPARAFVAAIAAAALLGTAACGGSSKKNSSPSPSSSTSSSSSAAPKPAVAAVNPLRGGAPSKNGVVAVKIDDTGNGRPQRNIEKADIVYIEEVEGGLTRLLAVYNSSLPTVEAVRSTRAGDPELLGQYGSIAYAASGGARNPLHVLDASSLKSTINDRGGPGFQRDGNRPAPYNLTADLARIAKARKAPGAKNIGLSWSAGTGQLAGTPSDRHVRTMVGGTPVRFEYDAKTKRYNRYIDGNLQHTAAGKVVSTPNVIVQFCKVTLYTADRDVLGNPNQYTHTIGKGKIVIFRDGRRITGSWSRPSLNAATTIRDAKGKPIPLRPGGAWVALVHTNAALS